MMPDATHIRRRRMFNQLAILLESIIIALAMVFSPSQRYQIATSMDASGDPIVWRLDVRTGDVDTCVVSRNPLAKLQGGPPWRPQRESRSASVLEEVSQMSASRTKLELALTSKNSHKTCADILFQIADPALAT
jgi:hypothetical protein